MGRRVLRRGPLQHMGHCQAGDLAHQNDDGDRSREFATRRQAEAWAKAHAEMYDHDATAESYRRFFHAAE